jgi:hypothetical protein
MADEEIIIVKDDPQTVIVHGTQGPEGPQGPAGPPYAPPVELGTIAGSLVCDVSDAVHFRGTVVGSFILQNPVNPVNGQKVLWEFIMGGAGGNTISFGSKFAFGIDISAVGLSPNVGQRDFIGATYNLVEDKWYVIALVKGY